VNNFLSKIVIHTPSFPNFLIWYSYFNVFKEKKYKITIERERERE